MSLDKMVRLYSIFTAQQYCFSVIFSTTIIIIIIQDRFLIFSSSHFNYCKDYNIHDAIFIHNYTFKYILINNEKKIGHSFELYIEIVFLSINWQVFWRFPTSTAKPLFYGLFPLFNCNTITAVYTLPLLCFVKYDCIETAS